LTTPASAAPIYDPRGQQLPNLNAMGASSTVKDLFIEVGHAHLPGHDALKLMGDAFADAPSGRVNLHFDVGATYPAGDPLNPAKNADGYLVPRGLARGGEGIRELVTQCAPGAARPSPAPCTTCTWRSPRRTKAPSPTSTALPASPTPRGAARCR